MKKSKGIIVAVALLLSGLAQAQEYKVAKNTGRLEIYLGRVTVEGHNGNEIIFSSRDGHDEKDERAQGLKMVNALGLDDNTGLGINVTDKGNVIEVRQMKQTNSPDVKILVPKGIIVSFSHESQYGGEASFKNLENEIEVSANYNSVQLENVSGPVTVKSVYGHVEADFNTNLKGPISIVSIYGYVDITLPISTKADLKMSTSYGEIFVAGDFKMEMEKQGLHSDRVNGKINGGGIPVDLSSNYGKIYLRKK